jgi:hypothetical protein
MQFRPEQIRTKLYHIHVMKASQARLPLDIIWRFRLIKSALRLLMQFTLVSEVDCTQKWSSGVEFDPSPDPHSLCRSKLRL